MNRGEKVTLVVFAVTALAWLTRADLDLGPFSLRGWASLMGLSKLVHDSTVAVLAALLLFVIPVNWRKGEFVLNWEWARQIPWGVLLLFGGGFALAFGFEHTGLSGALGRFLSQAARLGLWPTLAILCLATVFLSEFASNTALAAVMLPVVGTTAAAAGVHPYSLMLPCTLAASCGFMLPVATPPNAIVFGAGYLRVPQMVRAGLMVDLVGIVVITAAAPLIAAVLNLR